MNSRTLFAALMIMTVPSIGTAQPDDRFRELVPDPAKLEKLGTGMKFTEGPVWTDENGGFLIFSDIPANELKIWTKADGVSTWATDSNQTNGNTRDRERRLISCEHAGRRVSRVLASGKRVPLVEHYQDKRFNSPNDAVVKSDRTIWFTDPTYGLGKEPKEQLNNHVFVFDPATRHVASVIADFDQPNGLCFSPDEKKLYIADSGKPRHIRVFDVVPTALPDQVRNEEPTVLRMESGRWQLMNGKVFATIDKGVPDGIRCDEKGNVWSSAGDGVQIFAPDGTLIGRIPVPESPANLCFGGADGKTLFITARTSLYAIPTNVRGAERPK